MKERNVGNILSLIYAGAKINAVNDEGDTALHLALAQAEKSHGSSDPDAVLVELLLVFDADTTIKNKAGLTPWLVGMEKWESLKTEAAPMKENAIKDVLFAMHEVGAEGAMLPSKDFFESQRKREDVNHDDRHRSVMDNLLDRVTHVIDNNRRDPQAPHSCRSSRLLSLEGGGIRGLVLTRMLLSIERVVGVKIVEMFDWIAGTSTGGMVALALASGKSVMDCQILYMKMKDEVFCSWLPHFLATASNTQNMTTLLQREFGKDTRMEQLPHKSVKNKGLKVFVTTAEANREIPDLLLLRNYEPAQIATKKWCEMIDRVDGPDETPEDKAKADVQADKKDQLIVS